MMITVILEDEKGNHITNLCEIDKLLPVGSTIRYCKPDIDVEKFADFSESHIEHIKKYSNQEYKVTAIHCDVRISGREKPIYFMLVREN